MEFLFLLLLRLWSGKLHFTTINYTPDYTLHSKLFKCTFYTINYHTLHPTVTFTVKLNRN